MNALPAGFSFPQEVPVNRIQTTPAVVSAGPVSNLATEDSQQQWQIRIQSLLEWTCELLIANQQLRWALEEMKEHEPMSKTKKQQ
jgi:hypothetical protein